MADTYQTHFFFVRYPSTVNQKITPYILLIVIILTALFIYVFVSETNENMAW